ncbi:MAG: 2-succinyl-6-hydroxy-2,4-cyclohexadiene-1-carboxy late synthase [Candidatus Promineifilaceae bacterium]
MAEFVQVNGVDYFVTVAGNGRPLVLLHGFTGSSANWEALTAVFAPHFRLIAIDLLGHGRTASPPNPTRYQMEKVAADVTEIIQHTLSASSAPLRFNLLGYSMGGRLALYIALHYPHLIQSLILESASPGLAAETERAERCQRDNALADRIERDGMPTFVDFWEKLPLWESQKQLPDETRLALHRQRLQNNPAGLANSLRGMGTGVQPSLWPRLGELKMPVLLLSGALDEKFVGINRQMAAQMPTAQLVVVPDTGHTVHLERPSTFANLVLSFLV